MPTLSWLIPFCILALIFVVVGYRDLIGFLRIGPAGRRPYSTWLIMVLWLAGLGGIYYFWWAGSLKFYSQSMLWAGILIWIWTVAMFLFSQPTFLAGILI